MVFPSYHAGLQVHLFQCLMTVKKVSLMRKSPSSQHPSLQARWLLCPKILLNGGLDPSSTKTTVGSELEASSMKKLDGIESFMAPLMPEDIAKADILLKLQENDPISTTTPVSILSWLHDVHTELLPSTTEVPHPLAPSPSPDIGENSSKPEEILTLEKPSASKLDVKTEPSASKLDVKEESPASGLHTQSSNPGSTPLLSNPKKPNQQASEEDGEVSFSPSRPQLIGATGLVAAPCKAKPKVRSFSVLHSALEVTLAVKLLAGSKNPRANSMPQGISMWYNPCASHIGGL